MRVVVAAALDIGVVASVITGLLALGRLLGVGFTASWLDAVIAVLVVGAFYVVVARRSGGATVGEILLQTSYVAGMHVPLHPRAAFEAVHSLVTHSDDELTATSDVLRALGDPDRLRLVTHLLDRPHTVDELVVRAKLTPFEVLHLLDRFRSTGMLVVTGQDTDATYGIRSDLRPVLAQLVAIIGSSPRALQP